MTELKTSVVNGRKIVSPFDIAKKFVDERWNSNPELRFVYFLQSEEDVGKAKKGSEVEFLESVEWSKFSFLQGTYIKIYPKQSYSFLKFKNENYLQNVQ